MRRMEILINAAKIKEANLLATVEQIEQRTQQDVETIQDQIADVNRRIDKIDTEKEDKLIYSIIDELS